MLLSRSMVLSRSMLLSRSMMATLLAVALGAAACGGSDTDTASSPSDDDSTQGEASEESASGGAEALDIDAILAADLDACADEPQGDPIKVGLALDFGEVSGFADIPGGEAVKHLAALINCSGGVNGSPVEVQVQDIQGDIEVTSQATRAITFSASGPYFGYNPEVFTEVFEAGGGEIVTDQSYVPVDDVDFAAQVNAITGLADGSEVLYPAMLAHQITALRGQFENVEAASLVAGQYRRARAAPSAEALVAAAGLWEHPVSVTGSTSSIRGVSSPQAIRQGSRPTLGFARPTWGREPGADRV